MVTSKEPSEQEMYENDVAWGSHATHLDESEDAEVQGIFRGPMQHGMGQYNDDMGQQLPGLLANSFASGFGNDLPHNMDYDLNAPQSFWTNNTQGITRHRTPGPALRGSTPSNAFRYGLSPGLDGDNGENHDQASFLQWYNKLLSRSPSPYTLNGTTNNNSVTPTSEYENRLANEIGRNLGLDDVEEHDNFAADTSYEGYMAPYFRGNNGPVPYYPNAHHQQQPYYQYDSQNKAHGANSNVPHTFQIQFNRNAPPSGPQTQPPTPPQDYPTYGGRPLHSYQEYTPAAQQTHEPMPQHNSENNAYRNFAPNANARTTKQPAVTAREFTPKAMVRETPAQQVPNKTSNENAAAQKRRQELEESPRTRSLFKEFYKIFRAKEKFGVDEAIEYAESCLKSSEYPLKLHWKIYLEMADLAKRENLFVKARKYFEKVNELQPYAHQGWLEYSKMEEECGRLHQCRTILHNGLRYCPTVEQLLTKAIKHEERMNNLPGARALLSKLRNQNIDKAWKTILEGALLEARAGNTIVARKVFKYLMQNVPWYGPIYFEATKFEERNEDFQRAIDIVEKGLKENPRYGPLWFCAFRLYETLEMRQAVEEAEADPAVTYPSMFRDGVHHNLHAMFGIDGHEFQEIRVQTSLVSTKATLQRAMNCISKELVWKVHFEAAHVAERGGEDQALEKCRHAYVQSVLRCPPNLCWKVWIAGGRAELLHGKLPQARKLLDRAMEDVPAKSKAQVLLEYARLEEYIGNIEDARAVLQRSRQEAKHEWKVFLESVLLESRNGNREDAIRAAEDALAVHSGTGRLWAILVQLKHMHGPDAQRLCFREALKQVPKSGEVWCEGARIHMHPLSPHMNLDTAERYLEFAIQFTPQYGDSFIEAMRWQLLFGAFAEGKAAAMLKEPLVDEAFREILLKVDTRVLEQRCVNADPNYGALWFYCRHGAFDTARHVLRTAKTVLIAEITKYRDVYACAIVETMSRNKSRSAAPRRDSRTTPALVEGRNEWITSRLSDTHPGAETYCNFSTGLLTVNFLRENIQDLSDVEKNKMLFGSDQIIP